MSSVRFVAVDVETSGLYNSDRVVEVAAVTFQQDGRVIDEWDTLVNPGRDVGPTSLHGITASMVSAAPHFDQVAAALADRVHGSILVAHNLAFDARMLTNEYARLNATLSPGAGVCTLTLSGMRLDRACTHYRIPLHSHHRALADARAAAALASALLRQANRSTPATVEGLNEGACPRTLRRDALGSESDQMPFLARVTSATGLRGECGAALVYLDMLDWALADLDLSCQERQGLESLATDLGLSEQGVQDAHRRYFDELIAASLVDGVVTEGEMALLQYVATALGMEPELAQEAAQSCAGVDCVELAAGMTVCFTGDATYGDGSPLPRTVLCEFAEDLGLRSVSSVTKKACDLVCAADPSSLSGKATKARQFGIPVVSVQDFLRAVPGASVAARR